MGGARKTFRAVTPLSDIIIVDTFHYAFVEKPTEYNTKSEL